MRRAIGYIFLFILAALPLKAHQKQSQDSLVILMSSKSAQVVDVDGASYRKVVGPARFLHNDTYLLCDTAYWNVETKIIDAWGNVSILQEETVLTSDKLTYLVDQNLAQFRGSVVQLTDKDHNTLRTKHLDYNTKDSVAIFMKGGSMRDKDGQIIESQTGTYDSKAKKFTFKENVNMFTDSVFVKTDDLVYESELNLATFGSFTDVWKEKNMLSSQKGWYDRGSEVFFFTDKVHVMTEDQEGWCDSLFFRRNTSDVEMLGNAQVSDPTRNVFALAGRIEYVDSLSKTVLTRRPAVISQTDEENGAVDTVYLGAERLVYYAVPRFQVDSLVAEAAKKRLSDLDVDPVGEYRKKAAEAAAKAAEEAAMEDPNLAAKKAAEERKKASVKKLLPSKKDSLIASDKVVVNDTIAMTETPDTLVVEAPKDSTRIGFLEATRSVRIYKKDMQVVCDSLLYSDLDSLARLFRDPIIWQEKTRQYAADSIYIVVSDGAMEKASLMSEAFVIIQEDKAHYDQIKGTEMLAFFGDKGALERFDVLGGASSLFYIEENGVFATVNKTESKMLSATFKDGEIQKIYYYDQPKNDGYPKVQLAQEDKSLKGFNWQPDRRPADRKAVTSLSLRPTQRAFYVSRPHAEFRQTDIYFPGYISDIHRQIEVRDSLRRIREAEAKAKKEERPDTLASKDTLAVRDTISIGDSLKMAAADSLMRSDSLKAGRDSSAVRDSASLMPAPAVPDDPKALKKQQRQEKKAKIKEAREAARKKRQEEREKRWAELDKRDQEKARIKEEKRKARDRERKRRALQAAARQAEKDARMLDIYIDKYRSRKDKVKK